MIVSKKIECRSFKIKCEITSDVVSSLKNIHGVEGIIDPRKEQLERVRQQRDNKIDTILNNERNK